VCQTLIKQKNIFVFRKLSVIIDVGYEFIATNLNAHT